MEFFDYSYSSTHNSGNPLTQNSGLFGEGFINEELHEGDELQTSNNILKNFQNNNLNFPAIRGVQAGKEFYVVMCQLRDIPRLFVFDEPEVPPEMRAQRILNKSRLPKLVNYVLNNKENYIFSAITASIDGKPEFISSPAINEQADMVGTLTIPLGSRLLINDGQHRRAAIERVIEESPELGFENIPVVFFIDYGLENSQQMFADLNRHTVRPTQSLSILYDHRNPLSRAVLDIISKVPFFDGKIEKEKSSLSNRSSKLFTLSVVYSANSYLLKGDDIEGSKDTASKFWNKLFEVLEPWKEVYVNKITPLEFRRTYTCAHGVLLDGFGKLGQWLLSEHPESWEEKIKHLGSIDYRKVNTQLWEGVAMNNGRMSKSFSNVNATFELLKGRIEGEFLD